MRISETIEKFPKLSGLSGIVVKDLMIKTELKSEIKYEPIINEYVIRNLIKPQEIVTFDLEFSEIWIEVIMTIEGNYRSCKFSFEVKMRLDSSIDMLKDILIKLGIISWTNFVSEGNGDGRPDYFIFSAFSMREDGGQEIELSSGGI